MFENDEVIKCINLDLKSNCWYVLYCISNMSVLESTYVLFCLMFRYYILQK